MTLKTSELLQSDDEVAFILAHEMGHANAPEPLQNLARERGQSAIDNRATILLSHYAQLKTQDVHGS